MFDLLKNRWPLIVVLILFIMTKIPSLLLPYYWDESWPYAPAIIQMSHHGASLLPTAVEPLLSRGHPLFFHFSAALWIKVFGSTFKSLHAFALFISVLFLITIYEAGYRIFNSRVAFIALLLVATDVFFFVQSTFVLFEVLVAFLCFFSIYLYVRGRYFYATIALSALFLTKESGLIAGFIIGIDALIALFNAKEQLNVRLLRLMPVTIACIVIGLFFILQKHYNGWYVFPLYSETVLTKWSDILFRFRTCAIPTTFCMGYEYIIFFALLLYSAIAIITIRKARAFTLLFFAIPAILVYYFIDNKRFEWFTPGLDIAAVILFMLFYICSLLSFAGKSFYDNLVQRRFILLLGFFILAFIIFSSFAYFIARYEMAAIIPVLFLLAVFFDMLIRQTNSILYYPLLMIIAVVALFAFKNDEGWGDCNLGYKYGVKTQLAVVEFMERSNFYDKNIACSSFLETEHLTDRRTGFLSSDRTFNHITSAVDSTTDLVIFDDIETDKNYNSVLKNPHFELIYHIEMHGVWADIFRRR